MIAHAEPAALERVSVRCANHLELASVRSDTIELGAGPLALDYAPAGGLRLLPDGGMLRELAPDVCEVQLCGTCNDVATAHCFYNRHAWRCW